MRIALNDHATKAAKTQEKAHGFNPWASLFYESLKKYLVLHFILGVDDVVIIRCVVTACVR